jgi:hypothetical protein
MARDPWIHRLASYHTFLGAPLWGTCLPEEDQHPSVTTSAPGRAIRLLLSHHHHMDEILRVDHVAVVVVAHLELDPVDLAGELAALYVALRCDSGTGLSADVEPLVGREDIGCVLSTRPSPTFSPS